MGTVESRTPPTPTPPGSPGTRTLKGLRLKCNMQAGGGGVGDPHRCACACVCEGCLTLLTHTQQHILAGAPRDRSLPPRVTEGVRVVTGRGGWPWAAWGGGVLRLRGSACSICQRKPADPLQGFLGSRDKASWWAQAGTEPTRDRGNRLHHTHPKKQRNKGTFRAAKAPTGCRRTFWRERHFCICSGGL